MARPKSETAMTNAERQAKYRAAQKNKPSSELIAANETIADLRKQVKELEAKNYFQTQQIESLAFDFRKLVETKQALELELKDALQSQPR